MHGTASSNELPGSTITISLIEKSETIDPFDLPAAGKHDSGGSNLARPGCRYPEIAGACSLSTGSYEQAIAEFERHCPRPGKALVRIVKSDIVANELAMSYYNQSRYQDAEPIFQRVLENHQARLGANHSEVATCWNNLGALYDAMGDYLRAAENAYLQSYQILAAQLRTGPRRPRDHVQQSWRRISQPGR